MISWQPTGLVRIHIAAQLFRVDCRRLLLAAGSRILRLRLLLLLPVLLLLLLLR